MSLTLTIIILVAIVVAGIYWGIRTYLKRSSHYKILQPRRRGPESPRSLGLDYEEMYIYSEKKALRAWHVKAPRDIDLRKTVLIFHNRNEAISDWIGVLKYFSDHGISSIIFDYRGFGGSEGDADVATLKTDAVAAFRTFMGRVSFLSDHYALGMGIGGGVMLEPASEYPNFLKGIILVTPYPSPQTGVPANCRLNNWILANLTGVFNAHSDIKQLKIPLLFLHSKADQTVSQAEIDALHAAATADKKMILMDRYQHTDLLEAALEEFLEPVVDFIREN